MNIRSTCLLLGVKRKYATCKFPTHLQPDLYALFLSRSLVMVPLFNGKGKQLEYINTRRS